MKEAGINFPLINIPGEIAKVNDFVEAMGYSTIGELVNESKFTYDQIKSDPFLLKDMDKLVDRLMLAHERQESVVVFGDYDVDGVSGTAVMERGLKYLGFKHVSHIAPTRDTGYSIRREYINDYLTRSSTMPDLIVTVDCGIKSGTEINYIVKEMGIDVIVTDHHLPPDILDNLAIANVDPHRLDSEYPFRHMSGSFVALKAIEALNEYLPFVTGPQKNVNSAMPELQELAVLGIVADMMPIVDENKILVKECMPRYIFSKNKGIQTFTKNLVNQNQSKNNIGPDLIGWQIGPRINAAKRMGDSTIPLDMLLSEDQKQIDEWYTILDDINAERQELVEDEKNKAFDVVQDTVYDNKAICYVDPNAKEGVIGLIAGRLKEFYYMPTIVIGGYNSHKGELKGSCRSVEGVHILNILDQLKGYLLGYGGHAMAAGFSIREENLEAFVNEFYDLCNATIDENKIIKKKDVVGYIRNYGLISESFINTINLLAPYGMGNPEPEFVVLGKVKYVNYMGTGEKHVKITVVNSNNETVVGIVFNYERTFYNFPEILDTLVGKSVGLVGKLGLNEYQGNVTKQVFFNDIILLNK